MKGIALGTPEDVGWTAVFFASGAARWINGEILFQDGGGWMARNR